MLKSPVYLDHNATTPCDQRVVETMLPYFTEEFGNAASRNHAYGWKAEEAVELAREKVAGLVGSETMEITFTSGATESVNLAIKGVFDMYRSKGSHIITCNTEHKAVLDTCAYLEKNGAEVSYLEVDSTGLIDVHELEKLIRHQTILVAVMFANNETGVIQPVKEISRVARKNGVLFFSDATQAIGKIPVNVDNDGIDMMAFSAHKMYGPKGVGALYVRRKNPRVKLTPLIHGGGHEKGVRSGTLNVPGIVGFGKACEIAEGEMEENAEKLGWLRDKLEAALMKIEDSFVNGSILARLPHVSNMTFKYAEGQAVIMELGREIAVSSGSACSSATLEPSHVLKALGLSDELAYSSLRFSLGKSNTEEEIAFTIEMIKQTVKKLRDQSPHLKLHG